MSTFHYLAANRVAGYSGFVVYNSSDASACWWMIPGTWEYDWDNQ